MNHDAAYVARQIGKTENWVKRNAPRLPHHKFGRTYTFTDDDITAILDTGKYRPSQRSSDPDALTPITGRRAEQSARMSA